MNAASLIVYERTGDWAAAWRRVLTGRPEVRIVETRNFDDLGSQVEINPRAAVALELTASSVDSVLGWLASYQRRFPSGVVLVLAARQLACYEDLARELGAAWFVTSLRQLPALAGVVVRHAVRQLASPPFGSQPSIEEQVKARLPWS